MKSAVISFSIAAVLMACLLAFRLRGISRTYTVNEDPRSVQIDHKLDAFSKIEYDIATNVEIIIGPDEHPGVKLIGATSEINKVITEVKQGTLVVHSSNFWEQPSLAKIVVTAPSLDKLTINGSGTAVVRGIRAEEFWLAINGSGDATLEGQATHLEAAISGSADLNAQKLSGDDAKVVVSGSGAVHLGKIKALTVTISGSGDVTYSGAPQISQSISGSGSLSEVPYSGD